MIKLLAPPDKKIKGTIHLPASKSISNRLLIIKALCKDDFEIESLSEAKDTVFLKRVLDQVKIKSIPLIINAGEGGTTFRFLLTFLSFMPGKFTLTCSQRMQQRPMNELIEALRSIGADITNDTFPLQINGGRLIGGRLEIDSSVSSQFVSALLLIAPMLKEGLIIGLKRDVVSASYIKMTIDLMRYFGAEVVINKNEIIVKHSPYEAKNYVVETDWSAASYWYAMLALCEDGEILLSDLKKDSLQGDALLPLLFDRLGVMTEFVQKGVILRKGVLKSRERFEFDFSNNPDLAQTIAVVCSALKMPATLSGLQTLKVKETDRLVALKLELEKFGVVVTIVENSILEIDPQNFACSSQVIKTYNDHRMAMAFAPLALVCDKINIDDAKVVTKSYPNFWNDLEKTGFKIPLQ